MHCLRRLTIVAGVIFCAASQADAEEIPVGQPIPLRVECGRCECLLPTHHENDQYYLILGCLSRERGPHSVRVRTEASAQGISIPRGADGVESGGLRHTQEWHERLVRARQQRAAVTDYPPAAAPPREKLFRLCVKEHEYHDPAGYVAVTAELRALGRHCLVYVDRDYAERTQLQPTVDDVVRTFDENIYPRSCGQPLDVDRDGRFTILFTPW